MSLTSYRAAPPRVEGVRVSSEWRGCEWSRIRSPFAARFSVKRKAFSVLCRPGGDLLSHVLRQSTIGAKAFDGRVRDGIGSDRLARATRPAKNGIGRRRTEEEDGRRLSFAICGPCSDV